MLNLALILPAAMMMTLAPAAAQTPSPNTSSSTAPAPGGMTGSTMVEPGSATRILTVGALQDMELVGADGKQIGDIEDVVEDKTSNQRLVVIGRGGFLGLGAKKIAVPLGNLAIEGEKATLQNMDIAQIERMAEFENENDVYRKLDATQQINLSQK